MRILGIDAGNKESGVALVDGSGLVCALLEERVSRVRYDNALPLRALQRVLTAHGLDVDDLDGVAGNVSENQLRAALGRPPRAGRSFPHDPGGPEAHGFHHLCHAAFAYLTSGLQRALVVTVDSSGDDDTLVAFRGEGGVLTRIGAVAKVPVPIGGVYELATRQLGFGQGGEGKVTGLAAYGTVQPAHLPQLLQRTGPWTLASPLLSEPQHPLHAILRAPWAPVAPCHADLAASLQEALESTLLAFVDDLRREVAADALCLGGGVALNCSLNGRLARTGWFERVWLGPSPADPGNAPGAALLWAKRLGVQLPALRSGSLGPPQAAGQVAAALANYSDVEVEAVGDAKSRAVAERVAADLDAGRIVGWLEGRSEYGPRALGHRSILGDPRSEAVRDRINDTKLRERWRPLAPSVLAEAADDWLQDAQPSPFMLMAFHATDRMRTLAPAAVHVDGTTRAQTVDAAASPAWHGLIAAFAARTGVPMVLNTSFNQGGEPIVEDAADALDCARRAGLDCVYLDGVRVRWQQPGRPADTRPKRPQGAVTGTLTAAWCRELVMQEPMRWTVHEGPQPPGVPASTALGFAAMETAPSATAKGWPLLALGDPARTLAALADPERTVIAVGPLSSWDAPGEASLGPKAQALPLTSGLAGVRALRRNLVPERIGSARSIVVDMPALAHPLSDPAAACNRWRIAWHALAEGLTCAAWLADVALQPPEISGIFGAWQLDASDGDGTVTVQVTATGTGPLPAIRVEATAGSVALDARGRLTLAVERRGERHERQVDTGRDLAPLWQDVAALATGRKHSQIAARQVLDTGDQVDAALARWGRAVFQGAGRHALDERDGKRERAGQATAREPPVPSDPAPGAAADCDRALRGRVLLCDLGVRATAVADGLQPAAGYENCAISLNRSCASSRPPSGCTSRSALPTPRHGQPCRPNAPTPLPAARCTSPAIPRNWSNSSTSKSALPDRATLWNDAACATSWAARTATLRAAWRRSNATRPCAWTPPSCSPWPKRPSARFAAAATNALPVRPCSTCRAVSRAPAPPRRASGPSKASWATASAYAPGSAPSPAAAPCPTSTPASWTTCWPCCPTRGRRRAGRCSTRRCFTSTGRATSSGWTAAPNASTATARAKRGGSTAEGC